MAAQYLEKLEALVTRVLPHQNQGVATECKHFFSGAAAYAGGRIFMTWTPAGLALKLPDTRREEFLERGATPLRYFPNGPVKKQYIVVPDALHHDTACLAQLISESLAFVSIRE